MAQFLRPNSEITSTSVTNDYTAINEATADNTDYIYGVNNTNSEYEAGLSSANDPNVHTGHIIRWRHAQADSDAGTPAPSSGGTATSHTVELYQGTTLIATAASNLTTSEGSFADASYTLSTTEASNITDYSALRIYFYLDGSGGAPANRRSVAISWMEMEIPDGQIVETKRRVFIVT